MSTVYPCELCDDPTLGDDADFCAQHAELLGVKLIDHMTDAQFAAFCDWWDEDTDTYPREDFDTLFEKYNYQRPQDNAA